ncbi:MAG: MFS transporter [Planctomycetes bacterium]|nr:MFS transporter [Planctomycetota bacterium]
MGRNILLLGVVSFLNDFSSEMIMPILPFFIADLGGGDVSLGLIGGARDAIASLLKVPCGYWSDRSGKRKIFATAGYASSAVFKLLLAFSAAWQHVLIFAGLERMGKGIRTAARDAIISESMPNARGKGFGIHRSMDTAGAILGSVVAFLLFFVWEFSFRSIIVAASILALFSLVPLQFVKDKPRAPQSSSLRISLSALPARLRGFVLVAGVFSLADFSFMFFIMRSRDYFAVHFPGKLAGGLPILLYVLFNIFYAVFAVPFGVLSDSIGRRRVLAAGYALFALMSLGFAFFNSLPAFIVLFALYGVVRALIDGNQRAFVSDLSPADVRATALGTYHTVTGLAALPASLIAGLLRTIAPEATFIYGGVVAAIAVGLFVGFGRRAEQ